jgi:uncharacterized phage protein gp47/JayE
MSWPLPQPDEIAERIAAGLISAFPGEALDPRAPDTVVGQLARLWGLTLFDTHLYLRWLAGQLMPDTATVWLDRHADIWGIARIPATRAAGGATVAGSAGASIPVGTTLRAASGQIYETTEAATVGGGGSVVLPLRAVLAGAAGNAGAGAVLALVAPIAGLAQQQATVAAPGLTGGAAAETDEALRARLLARIRRPPAGGTVADYEAWARAASADVAHVAVRPLWLGAGTVGVVAAMAGPRVPTAPEIALIAAAIEAERPVTAAVTVLPAVLSPVAFQIRVSPDTAATRAAITGALDALFAREAAIGARLPRSRISEAISAAAGEYSHDLVAPSADVVPGPTDLPTRGGITWLPPL